MTGLGRPTSSPTWKSAVKHVSKITRTVAGQFLFNEERSRARPSWPAAALVFLCANLARKGMFTMTTTKSNGKELSHDQKHALAAEMTDELRGEVIIKFEPTASNFKGAWIDRASQGHQWSIQHNLPEDDENIGEIWWADDTPENS
jgi:hypothetical protein